jgi:hypothetical protein
MEAIFEDHGSCEHKTDIIERKAPLQTKKTQTTIQAKLTL